MHKPTMRRIDPAHISAGVVTAALVVAVSFASPLYASDKSAEAVDKSVVEEAVNESKQNAEAGKDTSAEVDTKGEAGEASYNIENCEALIKDAVDGSSSAAGSQKLDLDKCKQLVK